MHIVKMTNRKSDEPINKFSCTINSGAFKVKNLLVVCCLSMSNRLKGFPHLNSLLKLLPVLHKAAPICSLDSARPLCKRTPIFLHSRQDIANRSHPRGLLILKMKPEPRRQLNQRRQTVTDLSEKPWETSLEETR